MSNANASFNELQRYDNARNSMRTLKNLADFLNGMRGRRKAVVFFSEGVNYNVTDPFNNPHATDVQREIRISSPPPPAPTSTSTAWIRAA